MSHKAIALPDRTGQPILARRKLQDAKRLVLERQWLREQQKKKTEVTTEKTTRPTRDLADLFE